MTWFGNVVVFRHLQTAHMPERESVFRPRWFQLLLGNYSIIALVMIFDQDDVCHHKI